MRAASIHVSEPSPPRVRLVRVDNRTPFRTFVCDKMGPGRRYYDVLIVKGTFALERGVLRPAESQARVGLADTYFDPKDPARSSVDAAGDAVVAKPHTDLVVRGHARPTEPSRHFEVSFAVHRGGRSVALASFDAIGPRRWQHTRLGGWRLTDPEPTDAVPIRYELAYGGRHPDPAAPEREVRWEANPVGSGHWDPRLLDPQRTYPGPQWEVPGDPVRGLLCGASVAGFGPIARWWTPRIERAGTYDEAWIARGRDEATRGIPLDYAPDFDLSFFQCAHPALVCAEHLRGDESLALHGMVPDAKTFDVAMPGLRVIAAVRASDGRLYDHPLPLDTLTIDLDARTVCLVWRLTIQQTHDVQEAILVTETFS